MRDGLLRFHQRFSRFEHTTGKQASTESTAQIHFQSFNYSSFSSTPSSFRRCLPNALASLLSALLFPLRLGAVRAMPARFALSRHFSSSRQSEGPPAERRVRAGDDDEDDEDDDDEDDGGCDALLLDLFLGCGGS